MPADLTPPAARLYEWCLGLVAKGFTPSPHQVLSELAGYISSQDVETVLRAAADLANRHVRATEADLASETREATQTVLQGIMLAGQEVAGLLQSMTAEIWRLQDEDEQRWFDQRSAEMAEFDRLWKELEAAIAQLLAEGD